MRTEIERLSRRARLTLSTRPEGSARPTPERQVAVGLTRREEDVLALLADGSTNRQIARTLYISERTVSIHVSHILAKLGVPNRPTAAATAYQLGLLTRDGTRDPAKQSGEVG
jgi:DNA-binding NarL/FixJ family response regulator